MIATRILAAAWLALGRPIAVAAPAPAAVIPSAEAEVVSGLPTIGKWMVGPDGRPAHWLGARFRGRALREPINVILVDADSSTAAEATVRVVAAAKAAGYPIRMGHSSGYQALIGGMRYAQLPTGRDYAFSNAPFELSNNHGRIFGPHRSGSCWVFAGAFSREQVAPLSTPKHRYASFIQARGDFSRRMDRLTAFKIARYVQMDNAVVGDLTITTGDHDGIAVALMLKKSQP